MKRLVRASSPEIVKIAGESSPCSAETSFRELDDVFLQTQTRIWLGEVLHIRFDEETTIADLLADGELLFQVSKKVWKMLLKKNVELKHSKVHIYERTSSGKSDGRYMPYPKVDSFLKICQILGLTGIDLFSPSDVVDKRDARRVCMCIRSFSKKARSKNLDVPDFDIVTYTIAMPTDLVGGIRRNLEQSHYSSSSSNGCSSPSTQLREFYGQKSFGGQNFMHYDSHSESDEAESAFTELEFQSALSNGSCDAFDFSNITNGQHSSEGNFVVDRVLTESQTRYGLDSHEHANVVDKRHMQNGGLELKAAFQSKSSLSHTECQMDIQEVALLLSSTRNIMEINNVDTSRSKYGLSFHDLDEPHAVEVKEDFVRFGPTLRGEGLELNLPVHSFTDSVVSLDHPKEEFVKTAVSSSTEDETFSNGLSDDFVGSEFTESSKKHNVPEFQDMVNEKTPPTENEVNDGGEKEDSSNYSFQMDPCNSVDTSDLVNSIDNGNDGDTRAKGPHLYMESLDLEQKEMQNGLKMKADDEVEVTQVYSIPCLVSSEDNHQHNGFSSKELDLCYSKIDISAGDHVRALDSEAEEKVEGSDYPSCGNHRRSIGIGGPDTDPTILASSKNQDIGSNLTFSSNNPLLVKDYHSLSCSYSVSLENNQISPSQFENLSGPANPFNCSRTTDCGGNESRICCSKDGYTSKEEDRNDSDEQVNSPGVSIMDEDIVGDDLSTRESKICRSTPFDVSDVQLMLRPCNNEAGAMEIKVSQEKDVSHLAYDMYDTPLLEVRENNTAKLSIKDGSHPDDWSTPIVAEVCSFKDNDEANVKESEECNEEVKPQQNSDKAEARTIGNRVLKSVVGTVTLLGAIFVFLRVRQRTREGNAGFIVPNQNHKPNKEFPAGQRAEIVKSDAVPTKRYPGDRLKF